MVGANGYPLFGIDGYQEVVEGGDEDEVGGGDGMGGEVGEGGGGEGENENENIANKIVIDNNDKYKNDNHKYDDDDNNNNDNDEYDDDDDDDNEDGEFYEDVNFPELLMEFEDQALELCEFFFSFVFRELRFLSLRNFIEKFRIKKFPLLLDEEQHFELSLFLNYGSRVSSP